MKRFTAFSAMLGLALTFTVQADSTSDDAPKAIPQTRAETKETLENLKKRQPRLPLSPATAEEIATAKAAGRILVNNGRMRQHYLPATWFAADFRADPAMTVDNDYKVSLFWIVSRGNNCQYCLGHQEHKLSTAGWDDDRIAALDGDWSAYSAKERGPMELARKMTLAPQTVSDADVDALRPHYSDPQIVEIIHTIGMYNSVNRWTDGLGIPQDEQFRDHAVKLNTPTSAKYANAKTVLMADKIPERPELESISTLDGLIGKAKSRKARVALLDESKARENLADAADKGKLPNWQRALAYFPQAGSQQIRSLNTMATEGKLSPVIKAQIAWVTARNNHAVYAANIARQRMLALGMTPQQIEALDGDPAKLPEETAKAIAWAKKSTVTPQRIVDADVERLRKTFDDHRVAEVVYITCAQNYFDRMTETLRLPVEE